jgi:hypothetical protein
MTQAGATVAACPASETGTGNQQAGEGGRMAGNSPLRMMAADRHPGLRSCGHGRGYRLERARSLLHEAALWLALPDADVIRRLSLPN